VGDPFEFPREALAADCAQRLLLAMNQGDEEAAREAIVRAMHGEEDGAKELAVALVREFRQMKMGLAKAMCDEIVSPLLDRSIRRIRL
jgi:hypothetical protein